MADIMYINPCQCNVQAARRRSNKDNHNKGKFFFTCTNNLCNFFKWDPNPSADGAANDLADGAGLRGAGAGAGGGSGYGSSHHNNNPHTNYSNRYNNNISSRWPPQNQSSYANNTIGARPPLTITFSIHNSDYVAAYSTPTRTDLFKDVQGAYFDINAKCHLIPGPLYEAAIQSGKEFANQGFAVQVRDMPKFVTDIYKKYATHKSLPNSVLSNAEIEDEMMKRIPAKVIERFMSFQREGVREAVKRGGRVLIGDEMGLGKTLQALAFCAYYRECWPVLVICPSSLRLTWKAEIKNWLDVSDQRIQVIFKGGADIDRDASFVINSYDLMTKMEDVSLDWRYKIVVCDECHYLKNKDAKRTKVLQPLVQKANYALFLSGTPALSRPIELYTQINMLVKNFTNHHNFGVRYADGHKDSFNRWNYSGASNLAELHWFLENSILIRRLKKDVMQQLPTKSRSFIMVEISPSYRKSLGMLKKQAATLDEKLESAKFFQGAAKERLRNDRRTNLTAMYGATGEAKLPAVLQYITEIYENTEQKFLVFAHHRNVLDGLAEHVEGTLKSEYIRIDGETNQQQRQSLCDQFQTRPECRIGVLSITAAGVGLTLTAADLVLFAELFWNPAQLLQGEDRAHRIGRKGSVSIKYVLADGTLDDTQWPMLQKKLNVVGAGIDGGQGLKIDATAQADDYTEKGREVQVQRDMMQKYLASGQTSAVDDGEGLDFFFSQYELPDDRIRDSSQNDAKMANDTASYSDSTKLDNVEYDAATNIARTVETIAIESSTDADAFGRSPVKKSLMDTLRTGPLKFKPNGTSLKVTDGIIITAPITSNAPNSIDFSGHDGTGGTSCRKSTTCASIAEGSDSLRQSKKRSASESFWDKSGWEDPSAFDELIMERESRKGVHVNMSTAPGRGTFPDAIQESPPKRRSTEDVNNMGSKSSMTDQIDMEDIEFDDTAFEAVEAALKSTGHDDIIFVSSSPGMSPLKNSGNCTANLNYSSMNGSNITDSGATTHTSSSLVIEPPMGLSDPKDGIGLRGLGGGSTNNTSVNAFKPRRLKQSTLFQKALQDTSGPKRGQTLPITSLVKPRSPLSTPEAPRSPQAGAFAQRPQPVAAMKVESTTNSMAALSSSRPPTGRSNIVANRPNGVTASSSPSNNNDNGSTRPNVRPGSTGSSSRINHETRNTAETTSSTIKYKGTHNHKNPNRPTTASLPGDEFEFDFPDDDLTEILAQIDRMEADEAMARRLQAELDSLS
ncbi:hypothetical protein SeMB42_g00203 [Synchytrium endobioticum]|uniref:DNA helicase n=1 Tax=Synchytrium endobioticum TaxID=286115 RepID=A0A507D8R5_9FUNG|nr:hypothetical protein SeLEV6574_g02399 [Synchytrium endobioticum]TPX54556.1 hypothetical protein SeMB42_g00203 [Synchytrium endobioticum]